MTETAVAERAVVVDIHNPAEYAVTVPDHTLRARITVPPGETKKGVKMRAVDVDYHRAIGGKERKLGHKYLEITPVETNPPVTAKK